MIQFLDINIDTVKRQIFKKGKQVKTSTLNYDLLLYFAENSNKIITRTELMDKVWSGKVVSDATIYKQVIRLKEGFLLQLTHEELVQTIRGKGFMFVTEVFFKKFS